MLSALQTRLRDLIAAIPDLAGVPVLTEDKGNLATEVENALATQALALVVAPCAGVAKANQARGRAASDEEFEVVIHRGLFEGASAPTTVAVLDALVPAIHGAPSAADRPAADFVFKRHDLRENADGTFARVVVFTVPHTW